MKKELTQKNVAQDFVVNVNNELNNVKTSFVKIGYYLETAKNLKYYLQLGFNNFEEMAESLFGFKKSTAYGLCEVWSRFHDFKNKEELCEEYKHLSYSQLLEVKRSNWALMSLAKIIKPTDTVKDIKKLVLFWNEYTQKYSCTPDGDSIQDIFEKYNLIEPTEDSKNLPNLTKEVEKFEEIPEEEFFQMSGKLDIESKELYSKMFIKEQPNFQFLKEIYFLYWSSSEGEYFYGYKSLSDVVRVLKTLDNANYVEVYKADSFTKLTPVLKENGNG